MIRALVFILIMSMALTRCSDPDENNLFDVSNSFVRFEVYNPSIVNPRPNEDDPLDTLLLKTYAAKQFSIPVVLSYTKSFNEINIRYSISADPYKVDSDFKVVDENGSLSQGGLTYTRGVYQRTIQFIPLSSFDKKGTITFEITNCSQPGISLGFPGPQQRRKTFVIKITDQ